MVHNRLHIILKLTLLLAMSAGLTEAADSVSLTILQTADLHAEINAGAWSRLATLIRQERRRAGGSERTLLVDCGDTTSGSLLGSLARGKTDLEILRRLRYDAWIPGNHEFDAGDAHFISLLENERPPVVCGNLQLRDGPVLPAWKLIRRGGARIAVIGMTNPNLEQWLWPDRLEKVEITPLIPVLKRLLPVIQKRSVDMIILAVHQGPRFVKTPLLEEVRTIGTMFPQIDLILGAHTHRPEPGQRLGNAWYVQPGAHGDYLARIDVTIDLNRHRVRSIESKLLSTDQVSPHPDIDKFLQGWRQQTAVFADRVVARASGPIPGTGRPGRNCAMSDLLCRAIGAHTGADVVFHPVFDRTGWAAGEITEADLFRTIPYENQVVLADLSKDEIQAVLSEQLRYAGTPYQNGTWGIRTAIKKAGNQVKIEMPAARPRLRVAFNSYVAAGGGGRFPVIRKILQGDKSKTTITKTTTRAMLRKYLQTETAWEQAPTPWIFPLPK